MYWPSARTLYCCVFYGTRQVSLPARGCPRGERAHASSLRSYLYSGLGWTHTVYLSTPPSDAHRRPPPPYSSKASISRIIHHPSLGRTHPYALHTTFECLRKAVPASPAEYLHQVYCQNQPPPKNPLPHPSSTPLPFPKILIRRCHSNLRVGSILRSISHPPHAPVVAAITLTSRKNNAEETLRILRERRRHAGAARRARLGHVACRREAFCHLAECRLAQARAQGLLKTRRYAKRVRCQ